MGHICLVRYLRAHPEHKLIQESTSKESWHEPAGVFSCVQFDLSAVFTPCDYPPLCERLPRSKVRIGPLQRVLLMKKGKMRRKGLFVAIIPHAAAVAACAAARSTFRCRRLLKNS